MATSGSTDFSLNRDQIITAALRKLRVVDPANTADANDITTGAQMLNLMIKEWQLDGVSMWLDVECLLHLEKDAQSYSLGSSGDNFCLLSDAVKTTLTADVAASGTALTVDSITGISDGDYIGIELDSGSLHWDTVSGAPSGSTVNITTGLASAASSDNYVFAYTNKIARPVEIMEARLRDTDNVDTPVAIEKSLEQFMSITDKTAEGDVTDIYLSPTITNSLLYTYPVCSDVTKRLIMTVRRVIEDFDRSSDDADLPAECLAAVIWNLALWLAPEYSMQTPPDVVRRASISYNQMKNFYKNRDSVFLQPG